MKLKPGDRVTVGGWIGEYVVQGRDPDYVKLDSGETVGRSRCTLVPQEPEWPGDWNKKAEFWDNDPLRPQIARLIGYDPNRTLNPWIDSNTYTWKHCRIIREGE
jgi:hypothetical protein